jgi:hypothetical protein
MFGIGKKIDEAMKKAQTDPAGLMDDHKKMMNGGLMGMMNKAFLGQANVDRLNSVMDMGKNAMVGQQQNMQLLMTGLDGTADVLAVEDTGNTVNMQPVARVTLMVQPQAGDAYQVTTETMVARLAPPRVGDKVRVKYSPDNPQMVAIVYGTAVPGQTLPGQAL